MSWELASFLILGAVLIGGFAWYERSRPTSQVVALVAALAALAVAGRVAFAAIPNVVATTDIVLFAGYALGPAPGFAVGALAGFVSNFWLGQGPWTPWQMAGWGMCGIFGAALALGTRNAGRLTLAMACGLAAVAYGALLNFSLMATYGGELSLQRYLALQSRAIPFEVAHAVGNVVLALIAGPAMVRMLVRFRQRFEWRTPALASLLLVSLAVVAILPARAGAATDTAPTVAWLSSVQNADGGWGVSSERESSTEITAWVMLGLEAAGRNPLDVVKVGRNPVDFLRANVQELSTSGDFARTILALRGAGVDPRSFGGRNLVAALLKRRRDDGSYEGWPGSTAFAAMALRAAGAAGGLDRTLQWLAKAQNRDGGWGDLPGSPSTADGTAAAMQAMPNSKPGRDGLAYLRQAQRPNGGFPIGGSGPANAPSTAWAVQGMLAVGADPASIRKGGDSALDYLAARRAGDGHYDYSATSDQSDVWVTGQVLAAVAGAPFPIAPVAREPRAQSQPPATPAPSTPPSSLTPPPSSGTGTPPTGPQTPGGSAVPGPPATPPGGGTAPLPGFPGGEPGPEGAEPEPVPAAPVAPPFEAGDSAGPKPWVPAGIGLGTGGIALGGVLFLGRRFGW